MILNCRTSIRSTLTSSVCLSAERGFSSSLTLKSTPARPSSKSYSILDKLVSKNCKINFTKQVYDSIFDKLNFKNIYSDANNKLNIIDLFSTRYSYSYYLNQYLNPKAHVIYPDSILTGKIWDEAIVKDPSCQGRFFISPSYSMIKHSVFLNLITKGLITPETELADNVNPTLLISGNFASAMRDNSFRTMMFFNFNQTSFFGCRNVKLIGWIESKNVMKYLAPAKHKRRGVNALLADAMGDLRIVAHQSEHDKTLSEYISSIKDYEPIKLPSAAAGQTELCFVEFQSNFEKYDIESLHDFLYIAKTLYPRRSYKLKDCVSMLGPGADEYLAEVLPEELFNKQYNKLEMEEMILLSNEFYKWPFKPLTELGFFTDASVDLDD